MPATKAVTSARYAAKTASVLIASFATNVKTKLAITFFKTRIRLDITLAIIVVSGVFCSIETRLNTDDLPVYQQKRSTVVRSATHCIWTKCRDATSLRALLTAAGAIPRLSACFRCSAPDQASHKHQDPRINFALVCTQNSTFCNKFEVGGTFFGSFLYTKNSELGFCNNSVRQGFDFA